MASSCGSGTGDSTSENQSSDTAASIVETPKIPEGKVFFRNVQEGQEIKLPFIVEFGLEGMQVEPAGEIREGFGHHHLYIDGTFTPLNEICPMDETHFHYGKGQLSDTLTSAKIKSGPHRLTLQFGNGFHMSYGETLSNSVNIVVK